jgi:diguanylate cyclase (GGDEF)-like protein
MPKARPRLLRLVASVCTLEVLGYLVATRWVSHNGTSGRLLDNFIYPLMEAVAVVLLGLAARHASGRRRAFYALAAVSTLAGLCADITWVVLVLVIHRYPTPSLADVFYLVGLLILGPALWVGFGFGSRGQRIRALLDALMWMVVLIYVAVTVMIVPQLRGGQLSGADKVALAETLLAVVAGIWVAGVLMVGQKRIPLGMKLVTLGIAAQAASWVAYSYIYTVSPVQDGSWVLTGWQATWALLIMGAVAELNGDGSDVSGQRASRGLSVWVTTVGVVVLLGLIMVLSPSLNVDLVAVIAALVGFLIVVTRLHVSLSDRDQLAGEMRAMAETDALTGIANRRVFDARLSTATARAAQRGDTVGVITIDIDHFKAINDGYGHPLGDVVLQQVANRLAGVVRSSDTLARMGGEEFAVLAPGITLASIGELAERFRHAVSAYPIAVSGGISIPVTISLGAACMPGHAQHADELLRVADRALYEAKAKSRNVVHVGFAGSPQRSIPKTGTIGWLAPTLHPDPRDRHHRLAGEAGRPAGRRTGPPGAQHRHGRACRPIVQAHRRLGRRAQALPLRRPAARHRQGGNTASHPHQTGAADHCRDTHHARPRPRRSGDPVRLPRDPRYRSDRGRAPRAHRRHRLPERQARQRDIDRGQDHLGG